MTSMFRRLLAVVLGLEAAYVLAIAFVLIPYGVTMAGFDGEEVPFLIPWAAAGAAAAWATVLVLGAVGLWRAWHLAESAPGRARRFRALLSVVAGVHVLGGLWLAVELITTARTETGRLAEGMVQFDLVGLAVAALVTAGCLHAIRERQGAVPKV
jgi:hypothetical protein